MRSSEPSQPAPPPTPRPRRRRFQYSLRTMLIVMTIVAVWLGLLTAFQSGGAGRPNMVALVLRRGDTWDPGRLLPPDTLRLPVAIWT